MQLVELAKRKIILCFSQRRINYFLARDECSWGLAHWGKGKGKGGGPVAAVLGSMRVPSALVQRLTAARHAATNCNAVAACCNMLRGSKTEAAAAAAAAAADRKGLKHRKKCKVGT